MKKPHYAWVICACGALTLFCLAGLSVTAFSVFQPYLVTQSGLTNAQSSTVLTVRNLFSFAALFFVTAFNRRLGLRASIVLSVLGEAVGFVLYALADCFALYCAGAAVVGLTYTLGGITATSLLLSRWFHAHRSLALGICSAGTGFCSILLPPLLTPVIQEISLQAAFLITAAFLVVSGVLLAVLVRDDPQQKGLQPLGAEAEQTARRSVPAEQRTLSRGGMGVMCAAMLLLGLSTGPGPSHLSILYSSEGFSGDRVALLISVFGAFLLLGKCLLGQLADKFGARKATFSFYLLTTAGFGLCCLAGSGSMYAAVSSVVVLGFGVSIAALSSSLFAAEMVPSGQYASTVRTFQLVYTLGNLSASSLPGIVADLTGSYIPSFAGFAVLTALSMVAVQLGYRSLKSKDSPIAHRE